MSCRFCKIIQENKQQLYRNEWISVFMDIDPIAPGHVLIIPNTHYLDLEAIPEITLHRMIDMAQQMVGIYKTRLTAPGYSIMQNGGQFNDIGHFHLHVFPRYNKQHFNYTYQTDATLPSQNSEQLKGQLKQWLKAADATSTTSSTFPVLHTERLVLSQLLLSDITRVVQLAGNEKIARMTLNIPHPYNEQDAQAWIEASHLNFAESTEYNFAIRKPETLELMGAIGLIMTSKHNRAAVGYWMGESYWNRGYTSEALQAILQFGFTELKLNKIYATHLLSNPASGKVMTKNGMILEGELMEHYLKGDIYRSVKQYRLLKKEWEALK